MPKRTRHKVGRLLGVRKKCVNYLILLLGVRESDVNDMGLLPCVRKSVINYMLLPPSVCRSAVNYAALIPGSPKSAELSWSKTFNQSFGAIFTSIFEPVRRRGPTAWRIST